MTNEELKEMCAQVAIEYSKRQEYAYAGEIADTIRAIQLPVEQEISPVAWMSSYEKDSAMDKFRFTPSELYCIPVYIKPPSVAELEKQVAELKESLQYFLSEVDSGWAEGLPTEGLMIARERAK